MRSVKVNKIDEHTKNKQKFSFRAVPRENSSFIIFMVKNTRHKLREASSNGSFCLHRKTQSVKSTKRKSSKSPHLRSRTRECLASFLIKYFKSIIKIVF